MNRDNWVEMEMPIVLTLQFQGKNMLLSMVTKEQPPGTTTSRRDR